MLSTIVFLIGPLAWLMQLGINFLLVPMVCSAGSGWPLHLVNVVLLAAAISGVSIGRRLERSISPRVEGRHFLARMAFLGNAAFAIVIVATAIPTFTLELCSP